MRESDFERKHMVLHHYISELPKNRIRLVDYDTDELLADIRTGDAVRQEWLNMRVVHCDPQGGKIGNVYWISATFKFGDEIKPRYKSKFDKTYENRQAHKATKVKIGQRMLEKGFDLAEVLTISDLSEEDFIDDKKMSMF